ncbi:MAG: hypothetical protein VB862_14500 [Pirellulaceae bacterium]
MTAGRDFGWRSGSFLLIAILLAGIELQSGPLFAQATAVKKVDPLDWTFWRGPSYNGTSLETGLIDDWDPRGGEGSNVTWKREDLGGRSTPIVMNGKIYLLTRAEPETAREGERVLCLDAVTGKNDLGKSVQCFSVGCSRYTCWLEFGLRRPANRLCLCPGSLRLLSMPGGCDRQGDLVRFHARAFWFAKYLRWPD